MYVATTKSINFWAQFCYNNRCQIEGFFDELFLFFQGRFSLAPRYHNNVAEIYEGELQDYAGAIANYERAADYYKGEDSTGSVGRERERN